MMQPYQCRGDAAVRREYTDAHCRRLAEWFDAAGTFLPASTPPSTRERLWNCFSLLGHGDDAYRRLAEAIITTTPIDHNHFESIAAAELHLRYADRLGAAAVDHLRAIVAGHIGNMLEVRLAGPGTNNFTCMTTFLLLAAGRVLDRYEWTHPLASVPVVYTGARLHDMGMNALRALAHHSEHDDCFREWNSPTYTPISLHSLAKIVDLIDDPTARQLALEIELRLWRELLEFYHPRLGLPCGPWSRAYRVDILGQNSQERIMFAYLGLGPDHSVVDLLDEDQEGLIFHHDGDVPFTWSGPAWQMAATYHIPEDALAEFAERRFPHEVTHHFGWGDHGWIDAAAGTYISVQEHAIPGGESDIRQTQFADHAVGWRSRAGFGHSFPLNFHYALAPEVVSMREVRNVTLATVLYDTPPEWVPSQRGGMIEAGNFNNAGPVEVERTANGWAFRAATFPQFAPLPTAEVSLNSFVPFHFAEIDEIRLNDQLYADEPIELRTAAAVMHVRDGNFTWEVRYEFPAPVTMRLWKWANFTRFAAFWYDGEKRRLPAAELAAMAATGSFRVL